MIFFDEELQQITLTTQHNQLTLGILPSQHLVQLYFGKKIPHGSLHYCLENNKNAPYMADTDSQSGFQLELLPLVYPAFGNPDLRTPAFQFFYQEGQKLSDFCYSKHEIYSGKKNIPGLPSSFASDTEVESIAIYLRDALTKIELIVTISAFENYDVFTQHVCVVNHSESTFTIEKMMSVNLDFLSADFELLTLTGAWGRETQLQREKLHRGTQAIDSKRGASGHGQNPFLALAEPTTTFTKGQVYSLNLVYSGNFIALAEVDMYQQTRVQMGINPFDFSWQVAPQASFYTPEVVLVFAEHGLNEMSQRYHRFYTDCLIKSSYAKRERPILMNNWEATYFNFTREKLVALAEEAQKLGIELFVLDDGWFGQRNSDQTSLGDWYPNEAKLGGSLTALIEAIKSKGLQFGLWVEPEMVSKDSQLFQQHPEWIIAENGRIPQESRHQYVLDLSQREVQEYLIAFMTQLLSENSIDYIKWDMNRNLTDLNSSKLTGIETKELSHRYMLGLYRVLATITQKFPKVLFESCGCGGGRFDPGMLYYTPQIWSSDDTDAMERLAIQAGNSLVYPPVAMGCHISAVPNHQVGRRTSLRTREIVAQQGNFGYELDLIALSSVEKKAIKQQIHDYKQLRKILQLGEQAQLITNDEQNEWAWQKQDDNWVVVSHVYKMVQPNVLAKRLKLTNLAETQLYRLQSTGQLFTGGELMTIGLALPLPNQDYFASRFILEKVKKEER